MKTMKFFGTFAVAVAVVFALSSFVSHEVSASNGEGNSKVCSHVHAQGKRCNGTVGCSCSGFSPITNGKVWQQSYCRRCGHHKSNHK